MPVVTFKFSFQERDTTPDAFSFTDVTGVEASTVCTSNTITLAGFNSPVAISITGGTYSKNGGGYTGSSGTAASDDTISVRVTSSGSFSTASNAVFTAGGVSDTYTATTRVIDSVPNTFNFDPETNAPVSSEITSNEITLGGFDGSISISITGGTYSKNGAGFTGSSGTAVSGDTIEVKVTSSSSEDTAVSAVFTAGSISDTFTVTTLDSGDLATGRLNIGAGGLNLIGHINRVHGTHLLCPDTYGGYVWSDDQDKWVQIAALSHGFTLPYGNNHTTVHSMVSADTDANRWYALGVTPTPTSYSGIYQLVRNDTGVNASWTFPDASDLDWDWIGVGARGDGFHVGVDPFNKDVVIVAAPYGRYNYAVGEWVPINNPGAYISRDAGATLTKLTDIPDPQHHPSSATVETATVGCIVQFDASHGTTTAGGLTVCKRVYISSFREGVWMSDDGAQTFEMIPDSDGYNIGSMDCIQATGSAYSGNLWMVAFGVDAYNYNDADGFSVKKFPSQANPGTASGQQPGDSISPWMVMCNQDSPGEIAFSGPTGAHWITVTTDNLATVKTSVSYSGGARAAKSDPFNFPSTIDAGPGDPGYLPLTARGDIQGGPFFCLSGHWDSVTGDYFVYGNQSVWRFAVDPDTFLDTHGDSGITFSSQGRGSDATILADFIRPAGYASPIIGLQDQGVMTGGADNTYPDFFFPNPNTGIGLSNAECIDYASSDSDFVVVFGSQYLAAYGTPYYTLDGGATYELASAVLVGFPNNGAAATPDNWVIAGVGQGGSYVPQYTTDRGETYTPCGGDLPNANVYVRSTGVGTRCVAADRGNIGTFYVFAQGYGIYKSTDGGANFTLCSASDPYKNSFGDFSQMRAIPGKAGHFVISGGVDLLVTNDGFDTIFPVSQASIGMGIAYAGFGAVAPGASFPRMWAYEFASRRFAYCDNLDVAFDEETPDFVDVVLPITGDSANTDWHLYFDCDLYLRGFNGDETDYRVAYFGTSGYGAFQLVIP